MTLKVLNIFAFLLFWAWAIGAARDGNGFMMVWNTGFCVYFAREMIFT